MAGALDKETIAGASPAMLPQLIPHLPEGQLRRALALTRSLDDATLRGQALAALFVRTNDRALLREAIEAASTIEEGRGYALLELAEQIPVKARAEVIEAALDRAVSDDDFGFALGGSLRLAPAKLLPKLVGYLPRLTDRWTRLEALTAIGRRAAELDEATRDAVIATARVTPTRTRMAALAAIAPLLEPAERDELVKLSLRRARRDPPDLELAPSLLRWWPDDDRHALLERWLTSDEVDGDGLEDALLDSIDLADVEGLLPWLRPAFKAGEVNATSFAAVAARLAEDGQVRVLALARAMRQGESRSDMLAGLMEVVRPTALRRALLAARTGRARADWARALSFSAYTLDPSLVPLAIAIVRESPSAAIRLRGLASLAVRAEGPLRRALVGEVIGLLATARSGDADTAVFDVGDILTPDEADAIATIFMKRFAHADATSMVGSLADALGSSSFARFLGDLVPSAGEAATTLIMSRSRPLSAAAYRSALRNASRLPDLGRVARTLSHLLAMPGQAAVGPTPGAVLDMARRSADDDTITQVIEQLAPSLPFDLAYPSARKVSDPYLRRMALEAVLPFAPADKAAAVQRAVDRLPEGGKGAGGGDEGPGLSESLGGLSPADAGSASTDLLDVLAPGPTRALPPPIPPPMRADLPVGAEAPPMPTAALAAPPGARARSAGVVSTGFADVDRPMGALAPDMTLAAGRRYLFWFELGEPVAGSIEAAPARLMVPVGEVRLVVLLYSPDGEIEIGPGRAEFELGAGGTFIATASPGGQFPKGGRRVGFEVTMPKRPGAVRLRCSVLAHGVLLQSRLITVHVTPEPHRRAKALRSVLDYDIAPSLQAASVADRETHALSILLNEADGTHTFYFAGGGDDPKLVGSADIGPLVIQTVVEEARGALRLASWGSDAEWDGKAPYAYEKPGDPDQLRTDLVRFANRGYSLYNTLLETLGYAREEELCALLRLPTFVQMAHLSDPRLILPIAMVYDRDLDTGLDPADIKLCPGFAKALADKVELKESSCWKGDCPSAGKDDVVCPSGFWGFRHAIGVPPSFKGREAARRIKRSAPMSAVAAVTTDPAFHRWPDHAKVLQDLEPKVDWTITFDREDALLRFADSKPQLVYFFCHGGVANGKPFLRVGSPDGPLIFGDTFRTKHIDWTDPRPIVLVNGCHTTALGPEVAQPLVSGLMFNANAAGVIGTEVTIFEPLAVEFAESFLRAFDAGAMLGWAVRDARLTLLGRGNPLGLVYIPFAAADLELS